ncbi:hypothetical protein CRUP_012440 [Coryphaenoides rupestris]|nr:hypothetical protein CRUP_012440 [Coryphaenoides rupestris]
MCHVIVTCRSMLWTLFSIVVAFAELIAFMSTDWLLGFPRPDAGGEEYRPSLGLYGRCLRVGSQARGVTCGPYARTFGEVASLLLMVGLMLYPAGWGSDKVMDYCGAEASPFRPAQCSLGWAFYAAIGGTLATFLCAVFSAQAEVATSSDKVQEEIEEGKSLICLV